MLIVSLLAAGIGIAACDPVYRLGAREQPAPAYADSCLHAALWATHRFAGVWPLDASNERGYRLALMQSLGSGWSPDLELTIEDGRAKQHGLELTTSWKGFASSVPLTQQRQLVEIARAVLEELHARCGPPTPTRIRCVAVGLGGTAACRDAA